MLLRVPRLLDQQVRTVDQLEHMLSVRVRVELEDGDDQLDSLHGNVNLFLNGHRHDHVLELVGEHLQLALELGVV